MNTYYQERISELQQEGLKLKIRHSDKVFGLCVDLDNDIKEINKKIIELQKRSELEKKPKIK